MGRPTPRGHPAVPSIPAGTDKRQLDLEKHFLLWRDRRVEDVTEASDHLTPLWTVRDFVPQLGKFGRLRDHLVQGVDRPHPEVGGKLRHRFRRTVVRAGRFATRALRDDQGSSRHGQYAVRRAEVVRGVGGAFERAADQVPALFDGYLIQGVSEVCGTVVVERTDIPRTNGDLLRVAVPGSSHPPPTGKPSDGVRVGCRIERSQPGRLSQLATYRRAASTRRTRCQARRNLTRQLAGHLDTYHHNHPVRSPLTLLKRLPFQRRRSAPATPMRPLPWLPSTLMVLVVVVGGGALALWLLNGWAVRHTMNLATKDAVTLRLDAIKVALTVAAGIGAGVTLLLALRRQSASEHDQRATEEDARERRITDLYVAAVEQLGSDKAAVRLGGLYALERLAQDNPAMRQTVVDMYCAYLRMPYTPPADVLRRNAEHSPEHLAADSEEPDPDQQPERRQELQVRLTAQRLLRDHTSVADDTEPPSYWRTPTGDRMTFDLTGATLVDYDLSDCHTGRISFSETQFHGWALLMTHAEFHGIANLEVAQIHAGFAFLGEVQFHEGLSLAKAQFHGDTDLRKARFHESACLMDAQFHGSTDLTEVQFHAVDDLRRVVHESQAGDAKAADKEPTDDIGPYRPSSTPSRS